MKSIEETKNGKELLTWLRELPEDSPMLMPKPASQDLFAKACEMASFNHAQCKGVQSGASEEIDRSVLKGK